MNEQAEPKRRGRPPKASLLTKGTVLAMGDGMMMVATGDDRVSEVVEMSKAQAYALRVWSGQSPDLPRNERMRRVALALEGQGMSMDGVTL